MTSADATGSTGDGRTSPAAAYSIPFNRPALVGTEFDYLREAIATAHLSGDGSFTRRCQALLERTLGVPRVLLTTSCTHALELAAILLEIDGDAEVIVPAFTFVSTANAFALRGARPVFADVCPDTLNLDAAHVESLVSPRTRAVVPVHYAGVGCDMEALTAIARPRGLAIVEDNAHGLFGRQGGRALGTFGALAAQSFHETKNFSCGEGGALLINDPALVERAEIVREKGTDRSQFFRGQVDKYTWRDIGSSYLPSDILAAFLFAQLEARERILATRRRIWETYDHDLADWAAARGVRRPTVPTGNDQAYHMYYLLMPDLEARTALIDNLRQRGILAVFHYQPLHLSRMGMRFGGRAGDCPVAEDVSQRLVRLPFYNDLEPADQARVVDAILAS